MLDEAAECWPEDRTHRARLLTRLAEQGAAAVRADTEAQQRAWRAIVEGAAGAAGPDAYPERYLEELRGDWPR